MVKEKVIETKQPLHMKVVLKNDEYHGKGTSYLNGKKEYEGSYSKGKYDGKGTLYDKNGKVVHSGKFADGVWKGSN
ncbi:hypothetical protein ACT7CT_19655 [Bacillus sanguinis]